MDNAYRNPFDKSGDEIMENSGGIEEEIPENWIKYFLGREEAAETLESRLDDTILSDSPFLIGPIICDCFLNGMTQTAQDIADSATEINERDYTFLIGVSQSCLDFLSGGGGADFVLYELHKVLCAFEQGRIEQVILI